METTTVDERMFDADNQERDTEFKTVTIEELLEMYR